MFAKIYYFCAMRFLTADYLFPLHRAPIKEGVLQISDKGEVLAIFTERKDLPKEKLEIFHGILCPGFVNTHCHLELSHMLDQLPSKKGLIEFILNIQEKRISDVDIIKQAIIKADYMMKKNGIVGVGDIANTTDSFFIKKDSRITYHTFIEVFGIDPQKAEKIFNSALGLLKECPSKCSLTPHATYSVSSNLYSRIREHNKGEVISIHNQETSTEDRFFLEGEGELYEYIRKFGNVEISGKRALQTILMQLPKKAPIILVHNTFITKDDIKWVSKNKYSTYYCTCPKANLYIEDSLPDYSVFDSNYLCVGTDSLASNNNLSILEELLIIKENSSFDINTLLKIASKNGAEALGMSNLGTFEKGKIPGVNLIKDFKKVVVID